MLSLLRNDIENPSYKRGLGLTSAMLFFYGAAFQIHAIEHLAPNVLNYAKFICLILGIVLSFRAMAERRNLREANENYVSMIDPAIISEKWPIAAILAVCVVSLVAYFLMPNPANTSLRFIIPLTGPVGLYVLGIGYARAAKRWTDDTR